MKVLGKPFLSGIMSLGSSELRHFFVVYLFWGQHAEWRHGLCGDERGMGHQKPPNTFSLTQGQAATSEGDETTPFRTAFPQTLEVKKGLVVGRAGDQPHLGRRLHPFGVWREDFYQKTQRRACYRKEDVC